MIINHTNMVENEKFGLECAAEKIFKDTVKLLNEAFLLNTDCPTSTTKIINRHLFSIKDCITCPPVEECNPTNPTIEVCQVNVTIFGDSCDNPDLEILI